MIDSIRFSRLSVCVPSSGQSSGDAVPPHHLVSELVFPPPGSSLL